MSKLELIEGDTGEAILVSPKVNGEGVHADRDGSEAPRPETPSMRNARDRGAEKSITRLKRLREMTDDERHNMLAWISGFAPDVFDEAVNR